MKYKIINNLDLGNNHSKRLRDLFNSCDTILIASPFLMQEFGDFFDELDLSELKTIHLITTLVPKSFDQIKKVNSLKSILDLTSKDNKSINFRVSINNKLHGKVYVFRSNNTYVSAIITSANFTDNGLVRNHEWGVEIFDEEQIRLLESSIISSIEIQNITPEQIDIFGKATNEFLEKEPEKEKRDINLALLGMLSSKTTSIMLDDSIGFWLKPIGVSDEPVNEDRLFNEIYYDLHFSKQRPSGVKENDILIAFGVGTTKLLSVYQATSYPKEVTSDEIKSEDWYERWPWYVESKNLTPNYGRYWAKFDLLKSTLLEEYLESNPEKPITAVGGKSLGALNFGKDKVKLAPDFARYIINKVMEIDNQLSINPLSL